MLYLAEFAMGVFLINVKKCVILFSKIVLEKIYQKPITIYYSHDGQ